MQHWMVKQEPTAYGWNQFVADGGTAWTGVRNHQACKNLAAMRPGDRVLFYHSVVGKEVVGIAKVARAAYSDPSAPGEKWLAVDLVPERPLASPVSLEVIKHRPALSRMALLRQSRLSVLPVTSEEFAEIIRLGKAAGTQG